MCVSVLGSFLHTFNNTVPMVKFIVCVCIDSVCIFHTIFMCDFNVLHCIEHLEVFKVEYSRVLNIFSKYISNIHKKKF